jgi:hypothetical protein
MADLESSKQSPVVRSLSVETSAAWVCPLVVRDVFAATASSSIRVTRLSVFHAKLVTSEGSRAAVAACDGLIRLGQVSALPNSALISDQLRMERE